uniref:Uncharacterized protein DDB_G0290685-like n=1 Tax=Dermatophagoides pteronyssinus TaxID=6956 RepID=A0A6P6Y5R3_DERPT
MCNNCFCFKSLEDLQAYREFQKYLKILQHNPQQQQIPEKVTDSVALLDEYFNEKISYESFSEKLSIQQTNDMNHESNKAATLVNKQCLTLAKLFSSQRYLDFYMNNNESINSDDQYSNNDPYEIFFNHFIRNGHKYTDLFVEILFNINILLKNILFCFEKIFKYLDNDTGKTEEDKEKFIKHSINNVKILNLFNPEQIIQLVDKFFSNFNQISIEMIKIFVPFFTKYINLYQGFLCMSIGSLKTSSKLLHILMSLSSELLANGFCLPSCDDDNGNDEQQQQQKDQQKNIDNAGFGDGNTTSDAKDVSDRLDCQDQLDDLENNNDDGGDGEDQQTDSKNEDNGIEMDDDFVGNEYGADEKQNDEKSDENDEIDDENDEDLEEQMGQVDDNEQVLDEKLWDNDDDDDIDEKDQQKDGKENEEQMTGGKEDFDTNKVANSDNDQLTSQNNNEEEDSQLPEDNDDDQDNQINDDYQNIDDDDSKQNRNDKENINEMILPDDVQIDMDDDGDGDQEMDIENENMEISDQDDDQNDDNDQNLETLNDENENAIEEPSNDDGDDNEMKNKNNQIEDGDDNDENTITGSNTENQNIDSSIYPNFDHNVQNNQDCLDSMEQSDEKSSKQQQQQQCSSSQLNDGKLTSQNEQQQQINDDEEKFSMLNKKKNRSLVDENLDEHLQTKRQKITNDSKKEDDDDSKEEEEANRQEQTDLFRHVENKKKADNIAYDIDYGQQQEEDGRKNQKPLERDVNLNDDDDDQQNNMESNEEIVKFSNNNSNNKNDLNKTNEEMNDDNEEKMIEGEFIMTSNVVNYEESSFHTGTSAIEDQNQKMEIEDEHSLVPIDDTTTTSSSEIFDNEFLLESEKRIEPLLYELCN